MSNVTDVQYHICSAKDGGQIPVVGFQHSR
jgi:hypothetical protein